MAKKEVHRALLLATPIERGDDVSAVQASANKRFSQMKIDRSIEVDGRFGAQTFNACRQVALGLGVRGAAQRKLKRGRLSKGTQKLIRGRKRTRMETLAAKRRGPYRAKLRRRYRAGAGEDAIRKGRKWVGTTEQPSGSNWGPQVSQFIKFTGYGGPVPWCGCFACWVVVKEGGAKIPTRIRMGYAPYITADALAGANGFRAVAAAKARPGDVVCLWGGQHVEVIAEAPKGGTALCLGGNTSEGGKSNNGGAVAQNHRALSDFDSGIVARPLWR